MIRVHFAKPKVKVFLNAAKWEEEKHPRGEDGKFGESESSVDTVISGINKKLEDMREKLDKTDPSKTKGKGKYTDQRVRNLVEDAQKWTELKKEYDVLETTIKMYPKAKAFIETAKGMLQKGIKPDGSKYTKDEKEWLKQQISSKEKLVARIEKEYSKTANSVQKVKVHRAST